MNRAVQYDLIRIFVCLQIVMMHAPLPGSEADDTSIMRYVLWHCDFTLNIQPYILQTFVIFILTFACAFAFCWLIGLLPFSRCLIGYQTKRK